MIYKSRFNSIQATPGRDQATVFNEPQTPWISPRSPKFKTSPLGYSPWRSERRKIFMLSPLPKCFWTFHYQLTLSTSTLKTACSQLIEKWLREDLLYMTNLKPAHCYEMVRCTSANMNKNCLPSFSWDLRNKASSLIVVKRASRKRKHFGQREKWCCLCSLHLH